MRTWVMAALLLAMAQPAAAQRRDLPVPANKGWQHAQTGVVLTATLAGLPRTKLTDLGSAELDVAAQFNDPKVATSLTIYIFRPALQSAPVWFDRAAAQIASRDTYGGAMATTPVATFTRPGGTVAAGLRQVFAPARGPYRSTAVAVVPLAEWLVAVRLSSVTLTPAAMGAELDTALAAIRWPRTATADGPVAVPVAACPTELPVTKAKLVMPTMEDSLLGGLLGSVAASSRATAPDAAAPLCRDGNPETLYGVYRAPDATDGYTLAIADSGRIAIVAPGIKLGDLKTSGGYGVSYRDLDGSVSTFPSFDRLPQPAQVVTLVLRGRPISRTQRGTDGKSTINITAPSK